MLADTKKLLLRAQRGRYALGHFNINNMEAVQAVVAAANKTRSPIILATTEGAVKYAGMEYLHCLVETAAARAKVPVALHLDHGRSMDTVRKALKLGYSSVMIDASHESFEKNIRLTKKVVGLAARKGIAVEAELGTIGGVEDTVRSRKIVLTDPSLAKEFVERSGCDFLAVAIGTSHGAYKFVGRSSLRVDILEEIRKQVKIPLVLHGASAVPKKWVKLAEKYGAELSGVQGVSGVQVKKAIAHGITKINTDTDLRISFDAGVRKFLAEKPKDFDPRHILGPARTFMQQVAEERMKLFGCVGKGKR